jgi:hypothetical protein
VASPMDHYSLLYSEALGGVLGGNCVASPMDHLLGGEAMCPGPHSPLRSHPLVLQVPGDVLPQ